MCRAHSNASRGACAERAFRGRESQINLLVLVKQVKDFPHLLDFLFMSLAVIFGLVLLAHFVPRVESLGFAGRTSNLAYTPVRVFPGQCGLGV